MRRTPLRVLPTALLTVLVLAVAGCGSAATDVKDAKPGPPADDTPSATPSSGTTTSTAPTQDSGPFDDQGNEAVRGTVEATTPEEQAVATAWFGYWDVRVKSFFDAKVDPQLGAVAAGPAVSDVVQYVAYLRGKKLHTVGDTKFGITGIKVTGATATLESCGVNRSIDRTADGSPAEQLTPYYNFEGSLTKAGGSWRVVNVRLVGKNGCRA